MLSTLLVIALFALVGGAIHLLDAVGKVDREPRGEDDRVLRVDLRDRRR